MPVGKSSQRWRFELQYKLPGAGKSGSLKQPTERRTSPATLPARAKTFTPHVGQKLASFQRPASEERRQLLNAPPTLTAASGKKRGVGKRAAGAALTFQAGAGVNELRRR